jgi:hypothetical protein
MTSRRNSGGSFIQKKEKTPDCPDQENFCFLRMPLFEEDTARQFLPDHLTQYVSPVYASPVC